MKDVALKNRKSRFNQNRSHYLTSDNRYYCYTHWSSKEKCMVTERFEVGKDISVELTIELDELDHKEDLNDRYESELKDPLFESKINSYENNADNDEAINPWDTVTDKGNSPEDIIFAEPEPENPQAKEVHRIIEEECTESQQDLFYFHFGMDKDLVDLRHEEEARTGKAVTKQAFTNRKNKIIEKVAKALGTERVKRCAVKAQD